MENHDPNISRLAKAVTAITDANSGEYVEVEPFQRHVFIGDEYDFELFVSDDTRHPIALKVVYQGCSVLDIEYSDVEDRVVDVYEYIADTDGWEEELVALATQEGLL